MLVYDKNERKKRDFEIKKELILNNYYHLYKKCKWVLHKINSDLNAYMNKVELSQKIGIFIDNETKNKEIENIKSYNINYYHNGNLINLNYETAYACMDLFFNEEEQRNCYNLSKSEELKKRRAFKRIQWLCDNYQCVFLTITFNPTYYKKWNDNVKQKMVERYLKANANFYVANIDFGKKNERLHYHCVCPVGLDYTQWHQYGTIKGIKIYSDDQKALTKYILKLTNHATKGTTKQMRTIYSKALKERFKG